MITRRDFFKLSAAAGASLALSGKWLSSPRAVLAAYSQSANLKKFVQPMRGAGALLASSDSSQPGWHQPGATHYTIDIGQYEDLLHPDLPNPTRLWGYGQGYSSTNSAWTKHLKGIIAAKRGDPVQITFRNNLPPEHILPVDRSAFFMDATMNPDNRVSTHLHGGFVPWVSDGVPDAWWDPNGNYGSSFMHQFMDVLNPYRAANEAEYYWPNNQGARLMWYHDHAHDLTRLNAYAGIATGYVIYDDYESELVTSNYLPGPLDARTVYMVFQDKIFVKDPAVMALSDPTWFNLKPNSRPGDLWYSHVYDPALWDLDDTAPLAPPADPSITPEYFGDTMLVNGLVAPYIEVEQRQYRFRMLNACQARFLNPRLVYASNNKIGSVGSTEPSSTLGPAFIQIGTEGGFLPAPAMVNGPKQPLLVLAPAERADLIVDFRNVPAGSVLILYSDAPAPYPMGDPTNDYYPNNTKTPCSIGGYSPNTRTLLQIRVKARSGAADPSITLPAKLTPTDPFLVAQTSGVPTPIPAGVPVRRLTLNEEIDEWGRLIQLLGNDAPVNPGEKELFFGKKYMDESTENVTAGATEVWEIINLTGDTHPIHFHLVNVQVLSRQAFSANQYSGGAPNYQGAPIAPDANELGWKETVRMNPGQVTRVIMKFDLPAAPFSVPDSPKGGKEYVWHCHILEHEEHDMMRPLLVK